MTDSKNPSRPTRGSTTDIGRYTIVPAWVTDLLAPGPLALYVHLGMHADRGGVAFPSRKTLAEACDVSVDTIDRWLRDMRAKGVVRVEPRAGRSGRQTSNLYVVVMAEPGAAQVQGGSRMGAAPGGGMGAAPTTLNKNHKNNTPPDGDGGGATKVERDAMWDILCAVCGINAKSLTKTGRSNLGKTVNELLEVGATPADVRNRAATFRNRWRGVTLTHTALRNRWAELAPQAPRHTGPRSGPIIES